MASLFLASWPPLLNPGGGEVKQTFTDVRPQLPAPGIPGDGAAKPRDREHAIPKGPRDGTIRNAANVGGSGIGIRTSDALPLLFECQIELEFFTDSPSVGAPPLSGDASLLLR